MPLTSRDVLFVLRAQDFASRQVRNLAGTFGVLGKQMDAVSTGAAQRISKTNDNLRRQTRSLDNAITRTKDAHLANARVIDRNVVRAQDNLTRSLRELDNNYRSQANTIRSHNKRLAAKNAHWREELRVGKQIIEKDGKLVQGQKLSNQQIAARNLHLPRNTNLMARNAEELERLGQAHKKASTSARRLADDQVTGLRRQAAIHKQTTDDKVSNLNRQKAAAKVAAADQVRAVKRMRDADMEAIASKKRLADVTMHSGMRMVTAGAIMAGVGAIGIAAMGAMTQGAMEFRQAVALAQTQAEDVQSEVTGMKVSIGELTDVAYQVGSAIPVPLEQLASGLYDIFSSIDVSLQGGQRLLTQFAKDAVAGQVELEDASRANIAVLNAWQKGAEGATDVSDTMFRLVERGIGTYGEFTNSIGRAIPATVRAGQEFDTLAGSIAFLTRQGLSAERASTSAARAFELLADPRVVKDLEAIGVQMTDTTGNFLPMRDILEQIADKWGHLPAPERAAAMMDVFSGAGYRIQARRFLDTVIPGFEKFNTEIERMEDRAGAAQRAYNTMFAQPKSQIQLLINNFRIFGNTIGEHFFGALNMIIGALKSVVDRLNDLSPATKKALTGFLAIISVVLALSGILVALAGAAKMVSSAFMLMGGAKLVSGLTAASTAAGGAGTALSGMAAILGGPWTIAIAAATIATVGVVTALKRMDEQTAASSEAAERMASSVGAAWVSVEDLSENVDRGITSLAEFREENKLTALQLREMSDEAARGFLIEIGVQLSMRSDMDPQELEERLSLLAEQADLSLDIPISFDELQMDTALESVGNTVVEMMEAIEDDLGQARFGGILDFDSRELRQQLDSAADMITSAFKIDNDTAAFVANIKTMEDAINSSAQTDEGKAKALNHLNDQIAKMVGVTGDAAIHNINNLTELIGVMGDQALLTEGEVAALLSLVTDGRWEHPFGNMGIPTLNDVVGAARGAEGGIDGVAGALDGAADSAEEATNALQDYHNELLGQTDPIFKAISAQHDYESSVIDVKKAEEDLKMVLESEDATAADIAESRLALRESNLALAESERDRVLALGSMLDAEGRIITSAQQLREALKEAKFPPETIKAIMSDADLVVGLLDDLAKQREVDVIIRPEKQKQVSDALRSITNDAGEIIVTSEQAKAQLSKIGVSDATIASLGNDTSAMVALINKVAKRWQVDVNVNTYNVDRLASLQRSLNAIDGNYTANVMNTVTTVRRTYFEGGGAASRVGGGMSVNHEGGWAGESNVFKSLADIKKDEIPAILQRGEYVLSRKMIDQLGSMPRFHSGGTTGGAGPYAGSASKAMSILTPFTGRKSHQIENTIRRVNELVEALDRQAEAAENARRRMALVKDINAAEDAKARREATKALREFDREQAVAHQKASIQRQLERAEVRKQIALNREAWQFDQLSTQDQLANVTRRLKREQRFTDEWMSLAQQRQSLLEEIAQHKRDVLQEEIDAIQENLDDSSSAYDEALDKLNAMLDERDRLMEEMSDREIQYNEDVAKSHEDYAEAVKNAHEQATKAIEDAVSSRRDSLMSEFSYGDADTLMASNFADLAQAQNRQISEWHSGILELQRRGLSADVVKALGIADSPDQLEVVRNLLEGSVDDLDRLNRTIAERQGILNDIVQEESTNTMFELARTIEQTHTDLATELENLQQEHQARLSELQSEFVADMGRLREQLAAVGQDNGRTWSEAIAEGIESGIPAIEQQVEEVQRLLRQVKEEEAKLGDVTDRVDEIPDIVGSEADIRRRFEEANVTIATPDETAADRIRRLSNEILSGQRSLASFEQSLSVLSRIQTDIREAFASAGVSLATEYETAQMRLSRITYEITSGQRTMDDVLHAVNWIKKMEQGTFDSGGVLKPGWTLAYNGTGQNEYVVGPGQTTGAKVINIEEGAFQFNGPIDSATLPDVERLIDEFKDELADELRSN